MSTAPYVVTAILLREQLSFRWDGGPGDVRFALDQHSYLDFLVPTHWNKIYTVRCVAHIGHII